MVHLIKQKNGFAVVTQKTQNGKHLQSTIESFKTRRSCYTNMGAVAGEYGNDGFAFKFQDDTRKQPVAMLLVNEFGKWVPKVDKKRQPIKPYKPKKRK